MNSQTLSNTDRTSWQRVAMVWKFYLPYTRKKIIGFTLLAFAVEGMMQYAYGYMPQESGMPMLLMLSTMIAALMAFSGLVFAKPAGRELQTLLPALGMEKCIVIVGYVTLVIPFLLALPSIISWAGLNWAAERNVARAFGFQLDWPTVIYSVLALEAMALSCLWAVLASKRRYAIRNGIIAPILFFVVISFISGFISGFIAGVNGYSDELMGEILGTLYSILSVICGIYIIFALIKCCHIIKHGI